MNIHYHCSLIVCKKKKKLDHHPESSSMQINSLIDLMNMGVHVISNANVVDWNM